jgi:hypothetical protein
LVGAKLLPRLTEYGEVRPKITVPVQNANGENAA